LNDGTLFEAYITCFLMLTTENDVTLEREKKDETQKPYLDKQEHLLFKQVRTDRSDFFQPLK
jgi:hypothetical protein